MRKKRRHVGNLTKYKRNPGTNLHAADAGPQGPARRAIALLTLTLLLGRGRIHAILSCTHLQVQHTRVFEPPCQIFHENKMLLARQRHLDVLGNGVRRRRSRVRLGPMVAAAVARWHRLARARSTPLPHLVLPHAVLKMEDVHTAPAHPALALSRLILERRLYPRRHRNQPLALHTPQPGPVEVAYLLLQPRHGPSQQPPPALTPRPPPAWQTSALAVNVTIVGVAFIFGPDPAQAMGRPPAETLQDRAEDMIFQLCVYRRGARAAEREPRTGWRCAETLVRHGSPYRRPRLVVLVLGQERKLVRYLVDRRSRRCGRDAPRVFVLA